MARKPEDFTRTYDVIQTIDGMLTEMNPQGINQYTVGVGYSKTGPNGTHSHSILHNGAMTGHNLVHFSHGMRGGTSHDHRDPSTLSKAVAAIKKAFTPLSPGSEQMMSATGSGKVVTIHHKGFK